MELFKNIFFNTDKLTPYITVKITYAGKFFEDNSKEIYLHYSFNQNWEKAKDIKMDKSELGYQAEIELGKNKELNICFFNEKKQWDNNENENYNFQIEEPDFPLNSLEEVSLVPIRKLSKFYLWKKKARIGFYKIIRFITGNYKRKVYEEKN